MKVAVISDLHLGRGDKHDLFGHRDADFLRFLRYLERNHEEIILLGDIFETFNSNPWQQLREIRHIREAHPEIVKRFDRPQYKLVHGNHDIVLAKHGVPSTYDLNVDGTRIHFRHGHMHDWLIRKLPVVPEFFVWVGFMLARWGLRFIYDLGEKLDIATRKAQGHTSFVDWALQAAQEQGADVVVTAHTHRGLRSERDSQLFLNSGTCYKGQFSWLHLDTKAGVYQHLTSW